MSIERKVKTSPVEYNYTQQVPIRYEDRPCTDIFCTFFGIVYSMVLIVLAIALFNWDNYVKTNFPTDSQGRLCGFDKVANNYPFIYFVNAPQISRRLCVKSCPKPKDSMLGCLSTNKIGCRFNNVSGFEVNYYDAEQYEGRIGHYCLPTDQKLRQNLIRNANLDSRLTLINSLDSIVLSMILSLSLSVVYLIMVQLLPKIMNQASVLLGSIVILALSACVFTYYPDSHGKIPVAIILVVIFIAVVLSSLKNRRAIAMNGVFMDAAAKMFWTSKRFAVLYIPVFIILLTGFIMLILYQFRSFWSNGNLQFDAQKSIFWEYNTLSSVIFTVFLAFQAIWGLSFLKQSFNFVISGNAVSWYHLYPDNQWSILDPLKFLLFKHFGSVVAGSFMTGFFTVGDYFYDLVKPRVSSPRQSCYKKTFNSACSPCTKIFELVRSDTMAYINIAGNPYCNACRYCQYLSGNSVIIQQQQSTSRTYRLCAHLLIAGIVGIISLYVKGKIAPLSLTIIIFISLFISTFFISLHADASQAIAISFINNQECEKRKLGFDIDENRAYTFDRVQIQHKQIAEEVKRVLIEHPYRQQPK